MTSPSEPLAPLTDARLEDFLRACEAVRRTVRTASGAEMVLGYLQIDPRDMRSMVAELRTLRATSESHRRAAQSMEGEARRFLESDAWPVIIDHVSDDCAKALALLLAQVRERAMEECAEIAEAASERVQAAWAIDLACEIAAAIRAKIA